MEEDLQLTRSLLESERFHRQLAERDYKELKAQYMKKVLNHVNDIQKERDKCADYTKKDEEPGQEYMQDLRYLKENL